MGLDNPDTLYFYANLTDDAEYVVEGRRGTTADLSFQVMAGNYSADERAASHAAFGDRALEIDADGRYSFGWTERETTTTRATPATWYSTPVRR